jgi:putative ABC transport system permease protein
MIYGNREQALLEPMSIVMSEEKAQKYFPGQNPVGQIIYLNNDKTKPYTVKGVMADFPATSHLYPYDFLLAISGDIFYNGEQDNWGASNYVSYVKLRHGTDYKEFEKKITTQIINKYLVPNAISSGNMGAAGFYKSASLLLQPIQDIHLQSYDIQDYDTDKRGDIRFVWLFGGIAGFILLIACINFVNLSTAKSANRAKEVGLRKVVGSHRSGLIAQFLTESMFFSFLSFAFGVVIAWSTLPLFATLSGKILSFPWSNGLFFLLILASAFLIGLLAGLYPAFYLSGFKPIQVLKGQVSRGSRNPVLRSGLVVFQFTTSIVLIIGTLIINSQMQFILNKKIGYDKDQVMVIQGTSTLGEKITTFKEELQQLPQVASVSVGDYLPVRISGVKRNGNPFWKEGKSKEDAAVSGQMWETDEDFVKTLGMELVEGRGFSRELATDSESVIINEAMAKSLNLENPVGARITNGDNFTVIGVVKDFNFESLKGEINPLCMRLSNSPSMVSVKINTAYGMAGTIKEISALWKELSPIQAIRFSVLDESYAHMYEGVQRMGYIFSCFAVLAIVIACLGLFGLAAFTTEQRTKEMGIRKVLGASVNSIVQLLSKEFVKLVLVAILIASPLAWWAMNIWLEDFAYRIEIQWWVFVLAGLTALAITLITVSFQAIKSAMANPVDSLRDE